MPRKIVTSENFREDGPCTAQSICESCGAIRTNDGETDRQERQGLEIIRQIAAFAKEDWKGCAVMLLYVADPNAPITYIAQNISLGHASICDARQRASERFPDLAGMLGLKTPQAEAQQERFSKGEKCFAPIQQGDLFQ
jgi:hypothetical protein